MKVLIQSAVGPGKGQLIPYSVLHLHPNLVTKRWPYTVAPNGEVERG